MMIPIDFVAGTHGHFLEVTLNKFFSVVPVDFVPFTALGTSHTATEEYTKNKLFHAEHWSELHPEQVKNFDQVIAIKFSPNDLVYVASVSLLRAGDMQLDNDQLEIDTYNKLNNEFYKSSLDTILASYPFLQVDSVNSNIPRYVLREFFKYGFRDPDINGYLRKQQVMQYPDSCNVFEFEFASFYNFDHFVQTIERLEKFLNLNFDFGDEFVAMYKKFIEFIPYLTHKSQCDQIIDQVISQTLVPIPKLTLLQESYINAELEKHFNKEMPFHQDEYFNSTQLVLQYIKEQAPDL